MQDYLAELTAVLLVFIFHYIPERMAGNHYEDGRVELLL